METLHIDSALELEAVATVVLKKLLAVYESGNTPMLALSGDLGAGKTTFMQVLAKKLGVTESVISPTYVIMKRYELTNGEVIGVHSLIHMDVYRIDDESEMVPLRFKDVLEEDGVIVCIEWAEKIQALLSAHTLYMDIKSTGESSREITFRNHG
ncbi:MAG: hypothetical protein RLZZ76_671 [Candidatus Parcubacteria bacterium]|jgi:tRNA threonylcarbamoyladenosine biosynthesis protein TsaE